MAARGLRIFKYWLPDGKEAGRGGTGWEGGIFTSVHYQSGVGGFFFSPDFLFSNVKLNEFQRKSSAIQCIHRPVRSSMMWPFNDYY